MENACSRGDQRDLRHADVVKLGIARVDVLVRRA